MFIKPVTGRSALEKRPLPVYEMVTVIETSGNRKGSPDKLSIGTGQFFTPYDYGDGAWGMAHVPDNEIIWGVNFFDSGYYVHTKTGWIPVNFNGQLVWDSYNRCWILDETDCLSSREKRYLTRIQNLLVKSKEYLNAVITPDLIPIPDPVIEEKIVTVNQVPWITVLFTAALVSSVIAIFVSYLVGGIVL